MGQVPRNFRRVASIYQSPKFISIETLSGGLGLNYREDEPYRIYLDLDATNELLGRTLLTALDKSRYVDKPESREFFDPVRAVRVYKDWENDVVQRSGFKSKRAAF